MKYLKKSLMGTVAGFLLVAGVVHSADNVAVIVNASNSESVSISQLKNIYSDRVINWKNGERIDVYHLPPSEAAADVFAKKVLGMSSQAAAKAESNRKLTNTVKNGSKTKRQRLVVSIVSRKKNAIGYVPEYLIKNKKNIRVIKTIKGN